jgi:hypothetical protein
MKGGGSIRKPAHFPYPDAISLLTTFPFSFPAISVSHFPVPNSKKIISLAPGFKENAINFQEHRRREKKI